MNLFKEKTGFILIELIIATAILAAVIPLSKIFIDTIKVSNEAKIQQRANHLAQQYLEEYKAMSLDELYTLWNVPEGGENSPFDEDGLLVNEDGKPVIEGGNYIVKGEMKWIPNDVDNLIGTVKISKITKSDEGAEGINIDLYDSDGESVSYTEDLYSSEKEYLLSLDNNNRLRWEDNDGVKLSNLPAKGQLNLIVEGNPEIKVNFKNRLSSVKELIINKTEIIPPSPEDEIPKSKFQLFIEKGTDSDEKNVDINALIRDTEQVKENELGVNIIVTVKDTAGVELAKIAETRKIRW